MKKISKIIKYSIICVGFFIFKYYSANLYSMEIRIAIPPLFIETPVPITDANRRMFSTLKIECLDPSTQTEDSTGTGFLWDMRKTPFDKEDIYLITNKHVAGVPQTRFSPSRDGAVDCYDLKLHVHLGQTQEIKESHITVFIKSPNWIPHPQEDVDLCMLRMTPIFEKVNGHFVAALLSGGKLYRSLYFPLSFPLSKFIKDFPQLALTPTDDILMIGYPNGLIDEVHKLPIFRSGIIASDPSIDFGEHKLNPDVPGGEEIVTYKEFLIDMEATPGSSGSPVVRRIDNTYYFLGIFCGYSSAVDYIKGIDRGIEFGQGDAQERERDRRDLKIYRDLITKKFRPYFHPHISIGHVIKEVRLRELFILLGGAPI